MKHSMIIKFLAFLLAALSLVAAVGGAAGIVAIESAGLYIGGLDVLQSHAYESIAREIANGYASFYAAENLGDLPYTLLVDRYTDPTSRPDADHWHVTLAQDGKVLAKDGKKSEAYAFTKEITIAPMYVVASLTNPEDTEPTEEETEPGTTEFPPEDTQPSLPEEPQEPETPEKPENFLYSSQETVLEGGRLVTYYLDYYRAPEYVITVHLREEALKNSSLYLLNDIYPHRFTFIFILVLGLVAAAVCIVYLVNAAGCCADGTVRPGGLNRIPLDLYTLLAACSIMVLSLLLLRLWDWADSEGPHLGNLSLMGVNLLAIAVIGIAYIFAFSAQAKAGNAYWWRHSVIGRICGLIAACFRLLARGCGAVARIMPLTWKWLLLEVGLLAGVILALVLSYQHPLFIMVLLVCIVGSVAVALYGGYCFAVLMKGTKKMSGGDLGSKIDTRYLRGSFLEFAQGLNTLSETAMIAAKKQMRSERMRSELITNVSHDIKTPLTSIINFVDLLQKPHSPAQQQEYLEVLRRQSGQMKKLIEDLMELSKASSGSIQVHLQTVDAVEAVNQALGEFSDKLEAAALVPVFTHPDGPIPIVADGRLGWRVLSNLLGNAVKYAMPGTRLYVDLVQGEGVVLLSLKNVSREPLTMDAEDLLERFVQGDVSRKTEGSGLGLNIAKTLMEVQGGKLQLLLDGDLFKATLIYPVADRS